MFYVILREPVAGIRDTVFFFYSLMEAEEFASCLHNRYEGISTETGEAGRPTDVFEHWNF